MRMAARPCQPTALLVRGSSGRNRVTNAAVAGIRTGSLGPATEREACRVARRSTYVNSSAMVSVSTLLNDKVRQVRLLLLLLQLEARRGGFTAALGPAAGADGTWIVDGVGDGVQDDTPAIQHALDAAVAAGGGTVLLPKRGPYLITRPLVICPQNPGRTFEDSWPPSTMHFASFTSVRVTSPSHAIVRASNKSHAWPAFDSNLTSGMLLIGVAVDGGGCTSTPLYSELDSIQFEGTSPFTPSAWASNPTRTEIAPAYPLIAPKAAIVADWAYHLTIRRVSITNINVGIYMKGGTSTSRRPCWQ